MGINRKTTFIGSTIYLKTWCLRHHEKVNGATRKEISWYFHTKTLKSFSLIHEIFYKGKSKVFPKEILPIFTDGMLAVWFMDDGSNNGENLTLSTHSFSIEDQNIIIDFLRERYSLNAKLVKDRHQMKIAFGRKERNKFLKIIAPYVPQAMIYKIVSPRNDLIHKISEPATFVGAKTSVPN